MNLFPRLYALEGDRDCLLSDRWKNTNGTWNGSWNWRIVPRGLSISELQVLTSSLAGLTLVVDAQDVWSWSYNLNGKFTVSTLSKLIDKCILAPFSLSEFSHWNSWLPKKVNVFLWRSFFNRLRTLSNLDDRGLDVGSILCHFYVIPTLNLRIMCFFVAQNHGRYGKRSLDGGNVRLT